MLIVIRGLMIGAIKGVAALMIGGGILWQVIEHCGSPYCTAIVHVSIPEVDITVDDNTYHVDNLWEPPIVCSLRPGSHTLRMLKHGRIVFEQKFTLAPGQEVVLAAWEETDTNRREPILPIPEVNTLIAR